MPHAERDYPMKFRRREQVARAWLGGSVLGAALACANERPQHGAPSAPAAELRTPARPTPSVPPVSVAEPSEAKPSGRTDSLDVPQLSAGGGSQRPSSPDKVRFVAIGDYGWSGEAERQTSELVAGLQPDLVITTGDNNYPIGSAATIDENIGQYFSDFIYPYRGSYGSSATENRFFPSLGNHDWGTPGAQPYLDYFTLPGNERYYEFVRGNVHFFAIDSDYREPDGITADSAQATWLRRQLAASSAAFRVVYMHHPPYSSGPHGDTEQLKWPYAAWGADLVVAGHDHCYERMSKDGITYVVSGLGGASIYSFNGEVEGSVARYNDQYGVTVFEADDRELSIAFISIDGELVDQATLGAR